MNLKMIYSSLVVIAALSGCNTDDDKKQKR